MKREAEGQLGLLTVPRFIFNLMVLTSSGYTGLVSWSSGELQIPNGEAGPYHGDFDVCSVTHSMLPLSMEALDQVQCMLFFFQHDKVLLCFI